MSSSWSPSYNQTFTFRRTVRTLSAMRTPMESTVELFSASGFLQPYDGSDRTDPTGAVSRKLSAAYVDYDATTTATLRQHDQLVDASGFVWDITDVQDMCGQNEVVRCVVERRT